MKELISIIGNNVIETEETVFESAFDILVDKQDRQKDNKVSEKGFLMTYDILSDYKKRKDGESYFSIEQGRYLLEKDAREAHKKVVKFVKQHKGDLKGLDEFCYYLKGNIGDVDFEPEAK